MSRLVSFLILPLLAVFLSNPAAASSAAGTTGKAATATARPPVNDAQLDANIRAKLAKSKIGKDGFKFRVARGVVTWEGTTKIPQHKGAATRMARTSGAAQVVNNIKVVAAANGGTLRKAYVQP